MGSAAISVSITGLAVSVFLITTLPVLIGILVRHFASHFAAASERMISMIATILFVVIVVAALAANWALFVENLLVLGPALIALNVVLIFAGSVIAKLLGRTLHELKTIAIETGVQNSTVGIAIGTLIAAEATGFSAFSLPSAVYGITMYFVTLPVILGFRSMNSGGSQS
jgi:BASS family bile acid:Na+ symporter